MNLTNSTVELLKSFKFSESTNFILSKHRIIVLLIICSCLSLQNSYAIQTQEAYTVTGTVTDSNGVPLGGVNIIEKNTTNGVQTDFDGNYSIELSDAEAILVFSYIGMKTTEIPTKGETTVDIQMAADAQALDEVVLVGYGKQKKISVVGSQASVDVEDLVTPVSNIGTMLAGRVSGLTGVQRDGLPGFDGADLFIRGISSFGGNGPLVLVDGVERSLDNVNPLDISSFSILKDASATAVYGVRGANGVILIETKRGNLGKPQVSLDYYEGFTQFTRVPELADGVQYMSLANEALTTRGQEPRYAQNIIDSTAAGSNPLLYPNVNWLDQIFVEQGRNRQALTNISGGSQDAQYYASLGYYDETGLFTTDDTEGYDSQTRFKRYNFTSNLTVDITKTTNINIGVQGYLSEGNYPSTGGLDDNIGDNIFASALEVSPVEYPVLYPGGFVPGKSANGALRNPYAEVTKRGYRVITRTNLNTNLNLNQKLNFVTKGLSLQALFSFDAFNEQNANRNKRDNTYFVNQDFPFTEDGEIILDETFAGQNFLGYSRNNGGNRRFYAQVSLNYSRDFGKHSYSGLLLANRDDFTDAFAGNFTDAIPFRNEGLAGRATYAYDDRYFFEVNAGYNGSENFAPNSRYGFFPSIAAGWVVSNEKFWRPFDGIIDYFKIRYSDGLVGSDQLDPDRNAGRFAFLNRVEAGQDGYTFGENRRFVGGIQETFYGVNVTWSESRKRDLGIELNAFDNKLRIIYDVFSERTEGAFLRREDIPNYIGLTQDPFGNIGIIENYGLDGTIEYNDIYGEDFRLNFRGTFSYNRNRIVENGVPDQPFPWLERRGTPVRANVGLVAERLFTLEDDSNGDGFITPDDGFPTQYGQIQPGDIKYSDLNEDGQVDAFDRQVIGDGNIPALTYGFGVTAQNKGFDASFFFQGQSFADRIIQGDGIQLFLGDGGEGNIFTSALDRWTPENNNPNATNPRLSFGSSGIGQTNNIQSSTWWLRKINFLRLKTAEIGYTLPSTLTDKIGINSFRLYVRGTNLLTLSNFELWDPELDTSNGNRYPNISVVSLGGTFQF